jgi:hypothetical protein
MTKFRPKLIHKINSCSAPFSPGMNWSLERRQNVAFALFYVKQIYAECICKIKQKGSSVFSTSRKAQLRPPEQKQGRRLSVSLL